MRPYLASLDSIHSLDYFHVRARRAPPVRGKGPSPTLLFDLKSNTASFGPCADIGRLRKERVCLPVLYLHVQVSPNSRIQANELRQEHRDGRPSAAARIAAHHPRFKFHGGQPPEAVLASTFALADAQLVIARE